MRKMISQHLGCALSCALALLFFAGNGQAQTTTFTYQGSLVISGSVASGSYDLQFKLYDQLTGGSLQGAPSTVTASSVAVTNGVFSVDLDFGASGFPGAARYLEISVRPASNGSFTTLSPRQQLTSTPYAIRSLNATSADTAATATSATNATNFSGSLSGEVTGTQGATVVSSIGGVMASNVASGATLANNATTANTASTIVKRDVSGNFSAGTITATGFSGSGASLTNLNASNIVSGTLLDSLLSSNVAKLNTAQTFTANQTVNANLIQSGALVQFTPTNGFVASGTFNTGSIPATGAGVRMMWYPNKSAFRAGSVSGTQWDDASLGTYSTALGQNSTASGNSSFAAGTITTASGNFSFAAGSGSTASSTAAVALGDNATASGLRSIAMGYQTTASGDYSTALGRSASTGGQGGSFVYGDNSTNSNVSATANNQFSVRAAGGLRFFASSDTTDTTKPGLFVSGTTGNTQINGNLTVSGTISGTISNSVTNATNFTGSLSGDVTGTQSATVVSSVGGVTASNIVSGASAANNATNANTASAIVKRDASGDFSAGTITGNIINAATQFNLNGNRILSSSGTGNLFAGASTGATNSTGSNLTLVGNGADVGAGNLSFATALGAGATVSANNTVALGRAVDTVLVPGNLTVNGIISGTINATVTSATNFTGSLSGDVTGTQSATVVSSVGGVTASNVASGAILANNATDANTSAAIVKRDASGNFSAGTITATGFSGNGASLTNLNASNISTGTLPDARLSSNVAKLNTAQTFTANQTIAANLFQSGTLVQFTPTNGFVAGGDAATGSIPATGAGVRMMWYPGKYAFRAGQATGTEWDDANVGYGSVAFGDTTKASNFNSVAMGFGTTSSGNSAVALGNNVTASGNNAVSIGSQSTAGGNNSIALGEFNQASGNNSVALGRFASTNSKSGSFVFNDVVNSNTLAASADNQFNVRATGGLRLFASTDTSDTTKPGLFISGTTGNTQINGNLTVSGLFSGSGSSLTNLNATNISSGTLDDARLSSNVALLNVANTFTANQTINANLIQSGSLAQFTPTNGLVAFGTEGSGSIPATGAGIRMMWYPNKYAFRAGKLDGSGFHGETYWDDSNIGSGSFAFGYNTLASGNRTFATGYESHATGSDSIAIGRFASASASEAVALGGCTASGQNSTCLIDGTASADYSLATGFRTTASGDYSTAIGQRASTNGQKGSFVYGDSSSTSTISATTTNQFIVRAQNMWFGTTSSPTATSGRFLETSTGAYLTTGGTWTNSSSRTLKTNFAAVNPRSVLQKVLQLPIQTWNYKAEDAKVRHIGAISQDFHGLFGFGDSAETISTVDADGVALAAIQGLHEELKDRDARIERLEQQAKQQQVVIDGLRKLLCAQNPQADVCQKQ